MRLVLRQANLDALIQKPHPNVRLADYAAILMALRTYFGRGARGSLIRVGRELFRRRLQDDRLQWWLNNWRFRLTSVQARPGVALRLLLTDVAQGDGEVQRSVTGLQMIDRSTHRTMSQQSDAPVCWTAIGEIAAALLWGTGRDWDVRESRCRCVGDEVCQFEVKR
jgi:predicted hydrocarbon binding protein